MKKLLLIMIFVSVVFMSLLDSLNINCIKAQRYPLYEQVGKEELTDAKKHYYKIKRQNPSYKVDHNYSFETETRRDSPNYVDKKYVTLKDEDGTTLWTMEATLGTSDEHIAKRGFWYSPSGITAIRDYADSTGSMFWIDKHGNELNRIGLKNMQTASAVPLKDGEFWMIQTRYNWRDFGDSRERPNLASLIFCDRVGNILNTIDLKYANIYNNKTFSKSEDYIMCSCYKNIHLENQTVREYQSYLIKYDGTIIKEFDGYAFANGSFSENEDMYIAFASTRRIIDVDTGEFIATFKTHGRSAIANKEIGFVAVLDYGVLRIINYKANILLFHKKFDVYPYPKYVEITGDGKEVIVVTEDHLYTFRLKETNENY